MTDKEELIRAAETLKKYCETTRKNRPYHNEYGTSYTKGCMFALACDNCPRSISNFMDKLIYGIKHHD